MSKVWFITGAGSGIGAGTARAALRAGDRVIATGRNLDKVRNAYRDVTSDTLALVQLDVTDEAGAKAAVEEAVKRFGIKITVVEPGFFRTGLLDPASVEWSREHIEDYGPAGRLAWRSSGSTPSFPSLLAAHSRKPEFPDRIAGP